MTRQRMDGHQAASLPLFPLTRAQAIWRACGVVQPRCRNSNSLKENIPQELHQSFPTPLSSTLQCAALHDRHSQWRPWDTPHLQKWKLLDSLWLIFGNLWWTMLVIHRAGNYLHLFRQAIVVDMYTVNILLENCTPTRNVWCIQEQNIWRTDTYRHIAREVVLWRPKLLQPCQSHFWGSQKQVHEMVWL